MPRVGHRKSRGGCQRCKARHVKCDELKPRCTACRRHGFECDYARASTDALSQESTTTPQEHQDDKNISTPITPVATNDKKPSEARSPQRMTTRSNDGAGRIATQSATVSTVDDHSINFEEEGFYSFRPTQDLPPTIGHGSTDVGFSLTDLQLWRWFSGHTSITLGGCLQTQKAAQHMSDIACEKRYVLHAALALSALHVSSQRKSNSAKFFLLAEEHMNRGLSLSEVRLELVSEATVNHMFAFTGLVSLYQWAIPIYQPRGTTFRPIDNLIEVMTTVRRSSWLVRGNQAWIQSGPLRPLLCLNHGSDPTKDIALPQIDNHIEWLFEMIAQHCAFELQRVFNDALEKLVGVWQAVTRGAPVYEPSVVTRWPASLEGEFLQLLSERHHITLLLLAFFAPILACGRSHWIFSPWKDMLLLEIGLSLRDNEEARRVDSLVLDTDRELNRLFQDSNSRITEDTPVHTGTQT